MKAIRNLVCATLSVAVTAAAAFTLSTAAHAQSDLSRNGWVQVASTVYPGGTLRMDVPFVAEVETREVAIVVPQYCAPRAIASRAVVLDDYTGTWTHFAALRFLRQSYVGGYINAFYAVDAGFGAGAPFVSGLQFSFAQVNPGFARACKLDFYAKPARD